MTQILVPIDFSDHANNALNYAIALFGKTEGVQFIILNTYDVPHGSNTMLVSILDILRQDSEKGLKKTAQTISQTHPSISFKTISRHGTLSKVIADIAAEETVNYIVMGTLGAGGLKKVLIGSNTSDVVKKIGLPILVVPEVVKYKQPDRILFTTDFKKTDRTDQLRQLKSFARQVDSMIYILNVHREKREVDLDKAIQVSGLKDGLSDTKHEFHEVADDDVIAGIDEFVKSHDIHLVTMISRKLSFFESIFHKSLTKEMAMHTSVPLLVLHD